VKFLAKYIEIYKDLSGGLKALFWFWTCVIISAIGIWLLKMFLWLGVVYGIIVLCAIVYALGEECDGY
jgi:hypothetical protein